MPSPLLHTSPPSPFTSLWTSNEDAAPQTMPFSLADDSAYLLCAENDGVLLAHESAEYALAEFPDDSDESNAGFVETESDYSPGLDYPARFRSSSLDAGAREESVSWILKVRAYYCFRPLTAYLAVNYVDRFLASHRLPQANGWPLQLLSVACLSLAAKMEETLVPALFDLQIEDARFVFEPRTICKMELLVLTALNWRLRSVTPFTFLDYFAYKADPTGADTTFLVSRATKIILETIRDIEFLYHCPSSMAAAAIVCAADEASDVASIDAANAARWCSGLTREGIINCYQLMQGTSTPNLINVGSGSSCSNFSPNKRRRLC